MRPKSNFRVNDLKRAWQAAKLAGAVHPRVDVTLSDGTMLSISDDGTSGRGPHPPAPAEHNEWDGVLADKRDGAA